MEDDKKFKFVEEDDDEEEESVHAPVSAAAPPGLKKGTSTKMDMKLSVTSAAYDRGGKGYLDETEKKLRALDTENTGNLDLDKVYSIMSNLEGTQRKAATLRNTVVVLTIFALILAVSNVGTSFAAARLAKDTSVSGDALTNKKTGSRLATGNQYDIGSSFSTTTDAAGGTQNARFLETLTDYTMLKNESIALYAKFCVGYTFTNWNSQCGSGGTGSVGQLLNGQLHTLTSTGTPTEASVTVGGVANVRQVTYHYRGARSSQDYGPVTIVCNDNAETNCYVSGLVTGDACSCSGYSWFCPLDTQSCDYCTPSAKLCLPIGSAVCPNCTLPKEKTCCDGSVADCCKPTPRPTLAPTEPNTPLETPENCSIAYVKCDDQWTCIPEMNKLPLTTDAWGRTRQFFDLGNYTAWYNSFSRAQIYCRYHFVSGGCLDMSNASSYVANFKWLLSPDTFEITVLSNVSTPVRIQEWGFYYTRRFPVGTSNPLLSFPAPLNQTNETAVLMSQLPGDLKNRSGYLNFDKQELNEPQTGVEGGGNQTNIQGNATRVFVNKFIDYAKYGMLTLNNEWNFISWVKLCPIRN